MKDDEVLSKFLESLHFVLKQYEFGPGFLSNLLPVMNLLLLPKKLLFDGFLLLAIAIQSKVPGTIVLDYSYFPLLLLYL